MPVSKKKELRSGQHVIAPYKLPDGSDVNYFARVDDIDRESCLVTFNHEQKPRRINLEDVIPRMFGENNPELTTALKKVQKENMLLKRQVSYLRGDLRKQKETESRKSRKHKTQTVTVPLCSKPVSVPQRSKPRERCCMSW